MGKDNNLQKKSQVAGSFPYRFMDWHTIAVLGAYTGFENYA